MKQLIWMCVLAIPGMAVAADWGLEKGTPNLKSATTLAFGPENILLIGDAKGAQVVALAVQPNKSGDSAELEIDDLPAALADELGADAVVNDIAANPATGEVFIAATVDGKAALASVDAGGKLSRVPLTDVEFSSVVLVDAPEDKVTGEGRRRGNRRTESITDLAFFEGKVLVSGLKAEGSASSVREINFPFEKADKGIGVQIFHGAHGRNEDYSAMRTFVPLMIDGEPNLLGAYVCTPLVRIPLNDLSDAADTVRATTVAELGNRNRPLDMIEYSSGGHDYVLLSNNARGVMKIPKAGLGDQKGITERVGGGGVAGQPYETVEAWKGVLQMDKLNDTHAVVLLERDGKQTLRSVKLP